MEQTPPLAAAASPSEEWVVLGGRGGRPAPAASSTVPSAPVPATPAEQSFFGIPVAGSGTSGSAPAAADPNAQLDLCFMCDCTGSMSAYIRAAQQNIQSIVQRIAQSATADVRFALVSYRDHPPQDTSYITKIFAFTESVETMLGYVNTMSAAGGGDGPEAVTAAMHDTLHLPWRPNAAKVAVLIADAPPHGLEPSGDGFPNGDPAGRDPLEIARQMAAQGITCYSVGVEPVLGNYSFAREFMCAVAEITGGQAVALTSAALLADVIVNGSAEEVSLTKLQREVETEVRNVQAAIGAAAPLAEVQRQACMNLQARGVTTNQMSTDGGMKSASPEVWQPSPGSAPQSLAGAKAQLMSKMGPMTGGGVSVAHITPACDAFAAPAMMAAPMMAGPPMMGGLPMAVPPMMGGPPMAMMGRQAAMMPMMASAAPAASNRLEMAPPAPMAQASTYNRLDVGAISMDQVGRMMQKMA